MPAQRPTISFWSFILALLVSLSAAFAFLSPPPPASIHRSHLFSSADVDDSELKNAITAMRAGAIKEELQSYGISTTSFFEKSELVNALLAARKEGKAPNTSGDTSIGSSKKKKRRTVSDDEEEVITAKVEVITSDSVGPNSKKARDSVDSSSTSSNPFSGAGVGGSDFGPFGAGRMGNIADMLKGMGGIEGGANPFAGAGGNPFGDGAGVADAMKKVRRIVALVSTLVWLVHSSQNHLHLVLGTRSNAQSKNSCWYVMSLLDY
jgi:hypothetical protein